MDNRTIVKLSTEYYNTYRGVFFKKSLIYLRRQCEGFNILDEDCKNGGADLVINRIDNLNEVGDGVYQVATIDESVDWETGIVDDYNYKLIPYETFCEEDIPF